MIIPIVSETKICVIVLVVVADADVVLVVVVEPRYIPLKFGQNQVGKEPFLYDVSPFGGRGGTPGKSCNYNKK